MGLFQLEKTSSFKNNIFMSCFSLILRHFQNPGVGEWHPLCLQLISNMKLPINWGKVTVAVDFKKFIIEHILFEWEEELSQGNKL